MITCHPESEMDDTIEMDKSKGSDVEDEERKITPSTTSSAVGIVAPNGDTGEDEDLLPSPRAETEEQIRTDHGINSASIPPPEAEAMRSTQRAGFDVEPSQVEPAEDSIVTNIPPAVALLQTVSASNLASGPITPALIPSSYRRPAPGAYARNEGHSVRLDMAPMSSPSAVNALVDNNNNRVTSFPAVLVADENEESVNAVNGEDWETEIIQQMINNADLVEARSIHPQQEKEEGFLQKYYRAVLFFVAISSMSIGLAVGLTRKRKNNNNVPSTLGVPGKSSGEVGGRDTVPINNSSVIPTHAPTPRAWCISRDCRIDAIRMISDNWALLEDHSTAQHRALIWLLDEDEFLLPQDKTTALRLTQRYILALLYYALDGWNWLSKENYLSGTSECEWAGVLCTEENGGSSNANTTILGLSFKGNNMTGEFPDEILMLDRLESLDLENNAISGSIPETIGALSHLRILSLGMNKLVSTIPDSIGDLLKLETLSLFSNPLSGTLPPTMGNLMSLTTMNLYTGIWYPSEGSDVNNEEITTIIITEEKNFRGQIPSSFGNLINMKWFSLGYNAFTGTFPDWIGNMKELEHFSLTNNNLNGTLPESMLNLKRLRVLDVQNNNLEGKMTPLLEMDSLMHMSIGGNNFTGTISPKIGELLQLRYMEINSNRFSGTIPTTIGRLSNLLLLNLSNNQITGTIPSLLANMSKLNAIYLDMNQLTGEIPGSLGELSNLVELQLNSNIFTGTLPESICTLQTASLIWLGADCMIGDDNSTEVVCICCDYCCDDTDSTCCFGDYGCFDISMLYPTL